MERRVTSAAALWANRGIPALGKVAVAAAALSFVSTSASWITGVSPTDLLQGPVLEKSTAAISFDDRFGSRPTVKSASIYYPSRFSARGRGDFASEFQQIEGSLTDQPRDSQPEAAPSQPAPTAVASAIPMPRSRPPEADLLLPPRGEIPVAQAENRSLFQKIADLMPSKLKLASLEPNGGLFTGGGPDLAALGYDSTTAVYDITARTVYMPNGTKFEAHSGLGDLLDDPAHVDTRNLGATPPGTYDMKPRERLFHGVPALRMTPTEGTDTFGRNGLLVHSYMLGPNGDSNGCISIKNYEKFLLAYRNGEVKRIAVVIKLKDTQSASNRSSSQS